MSEYTTMTGPILAGTQFNWALLGTLTLQVYTFHISFPKERAWLKTFVYSIFFLDVLQTAICSHFAYVVLSGRWGDPSVLTTLPWSSTAIPIFTGLISASVQIFFAWRIYVLKGENTFVIGISVLIVLLALMQSLSAIISDARFAATTKLSDIPSLVVGVKVWLIGSAVCDVVITLTMVILLSQLRKKLPWSKSDSIITKLIYNTVETGAVTAVVAIVDVVLFISYPGNYLHEAPSFMLGKVYSNVLLAGLNGRVRTRKVAVATVDVDGNNTELQWRRPSDAEQEASTPTETVTQISRELDDKTRPTDGLSI
ncbi:hypothetical protein C8J57DRAFT_1513288 [Mycena rebaudengoi]|nr:hypothetical protein C8J57DRAFT_1513288 [Mycena rebaudengoi]